MTPITMQHVDNRFGEFVAKYAAVLMALKFDLDTINSHVDNLKRRLATRDFKLYGEKPSHYLHAGKRITRFYIKLALETSPAQKAKEERLHAEYCARAAEIRERQPNASFFSFEAAYAGKLKVRLQPYRDFFKI